MRRLLIILISMALIIGGGYLAFDFTMAQKRAGAEDRGLTVTEYLRGLGLPLPASASTASDGSAGLPTELAAMMPAAPKGWTARPTVPEDAAAFLPKRKDDALKDAMVYVQNVAKPRSGKGIEQVMLTYERADRRVIFQMVRYPDEIFTSFAGIQQRMELQMSGPLFRGTEFMTVRGLDISEDLLPEGMRGRYFSADVGAQIQIRIVAPKRMTDKELMPFLETLHVKAMNGSVVEKQDGLGDVPVIVLASALNKEHRAAYEADLAARHEKKAAEREQARIAEARAAADAEFEAA
ncbi:MAG: hypothetical protein HC844_06875, partial [Tabrizicola sp.]|nr:hypothetical protein [Tabrizicola sp.]